MKQVQRVEGQSAERPWWRAEDDHDGPVCERMLLPGDACPQCDEGQLAYNGLFQLACRHCKAIADPGAFT